jgi:cytochrome c oxidase subunit 4
MKPDAASTDPRGLRHARRRLAGAWLALLVLLALSALSAHFHLGTGNLIAGVGIAIIKAGIVAWIFMGLREAPALLRLVAAAGLGILLLLAGLSGVDFGTRRDEATPYQRPEAVPPALVQAHRAAVPRISGLWMLR